MNMFPKQNPSFVQANSVQSQFTALTNDRDKFRREKEAAERDHQRAQHRLQQLKAEQVDLMNEIRKAQEELGDLTRKQTMLKQEQARLDRVVECERKALENCAFHTKNLVKKEQGLTKKYCIEMGMLNDETADLFHRQVNKKMQAFLSVESIEAVVVEKLPDDVNRDAFNEGFELMKEAKAMWERELASYHRIKATLDELKAASKQTATPPGEIGGVGETHHNVMHSQQMDLFYGPEANAEVAGE
jgi:chromosome segregation ATPase